MFNFFARFFAFLLPGLRRAVMQAAVDEIVKAASPQQRYYRSGNPRAGYNYYGPSARSSYIRSQRTGQFEPYQRSERKYFEDPEAENQFHDVLLVAFDIMGPNSRLTHQWLMEQMPNAGDYESGINLDAWWVANDERYDESDTDSAVFVPKGNQDRARNLLRGWGIIR